jgi:hypothetical protein
MEVTIRCPDCHDEGPMWLPPGAAHLIVLACPNCGKELIATNCVVARKKGTTVLKKRSEDQERRAAGRYGGRVQPASGALDHCKGDLRDKGVSRGECKFTLAKSYSIKLEELRKIESEVKGDEVPFLEIEFQGVHPSKRYVILPDWAFQSLLQKKETA